MFKRILRLVLAGALFGSGLLSGRSQEAETSIPSQRYDIVVTATRVETPIREVASSISVITKAMLERMHWFTVLEALKDVLGTSVIQNGGPGSAASVMLRGANSEHTLILLDGVELNDPMTPSRSYDLAHIPLDQVERIEILRGPQSTLFGSDAQGGVIHIITRRGEGRLKTGFSFTGGSLKTAGGRLDFTGASGRLDYCLGFSFLRCGGLSAADSAFSGNTEKDGYRNMSLAGRVGLKLKEGLDLDITIRSVRTRSDLDNFGGAGGDDPNSAQRYNSLFGRAQLRGLYLNGRWESKFGLALLQYDRRNENPSDLVHRFDSEKGFFKSRRMKLDWQNNIFLRPSHTLTFGLEYEEEWGRSEYESESLWGSFLSSFPQRRAADAGIYLQDQTRIGGRFFATAGIRIDTHSRSDAAVTGRIAPAWIIGRTGMKLKATLGTGFKSPSLYQLYAPPSAWGPIGNRELKPEESTGWDAGIEQEFARGMFKLAAAYFHNSFRNLISFDYARGFVNIGRAVTKGIELSGEASPFPGLSLKVSYTRLNAKDKDTRLDLPRRPKDKFSAGLDCRFLKNIDIALRVNSIGRRSDLDFNQWPSAPVTLPAYTLFDATISFSSGPRTELFIRLDNILNRRYEMIYGYGTPRFCVYTGLNLKLE